MPPAGAQNACSRVGRTQEAKEKAQKLTWATHEIVQGDLFPNGKVFPGGKFALP